MCTGYIFKGKLHNVKREVIYHKRFYDKDSFSEIRRNAVLYEVKFCGGEHKQNGDKYKQ
jgi:hypothetical protein